MALPGSTMTIRDGALGIVASDNTRVSAKVGCASSGTVNAVVVASTKQVVKDTFGSGPLVEAACYHLDVAGGPVMLVRTPSSTAGAVGTITPVKTGTATLTAPGGATDAFDVVVVIVQGGATLVAGAATFKYSLDAGRTYSAEISIPTGGTYLMPNTGITLTWAYTSGTAFIAGDQWTASSTGPASTLSETMAAIDAVLADPQSIFNVHVLGIPATAADGATLFAALDAKLEGAATNLFRYLYGTIDLPADTDANLKAAFLSVASTRVEVAAGFAALTSAVNGSAYKRPVGWVSTARAASVVPSESVGRYASGPARGIVALYRDENATPGLDAARFTTLRTFVDAPGYYLTDGRIMAAPGSDFGTVARRRVMDLATSTVRLAQLRYVQDNLRVSASTGRVLTEEANDVDNFIESLLRAAVVSPGYASAATARMDRTANILTTEILDVTYSVVPLGTARQVRGSIGFRNPAIAAV